MDDRPALQVDVAVGEALRAVARDVLAQARRAIADPETTDAEAVHDFRRAMKRWRALLRLLEAFVGEDARRLRAEARDLAAALSGARDAQAALDALRDLAEHGLVLSSRAITGLEQRIQAIRAAAETTVINPATRERLADALSRAEATVERWPLHVATFDQVADELAYFYRNVRQRIPSDWAAASADTLHELRKWVVIHRYQMDMIEPLWPRFARMWTAEAQRLRDRLGKHQDVVMLEALIRPHQPLVRWRSRLAPAIAERRTAHVAAAARMTTRLFVEKGNAFRRRLGVIWEGAA